MKRWKLALGGALSAGVIGLAALSSAAAAPVNSPNWDTLTGTCEGLGELTVLVGPGNPGITLDGRVLVPKRFAGTFEVTIEVGGDVIGSFPLEFDESVPGRGFENRLVECSFEETFVDTITLTQADLDELGLDPQYLGETATISGSGTIQVWALIVGRNR